MRTATTAAALVAAALIWSASPTLADPVTYDLSATLYDGGTLTGTFAVNNGQLTAYDFTLPTTLTDPAAHEINLADNTFPVTNYISIASLPGVQIGHYYYDAGTYFYTVLNLQLNSLPVDSVPTSLGFSDIQQAQLFGSGNWDYLGFVQSSTISLAVAPVPGPIVGAGLPGLIAACGAAFGWWRRKRNGAALA